ncbi:MAG: glucokinase [Pseudomonadota bacterium]
MLWQRATALTEGLVADLGGTNCRLGLCANGVVRRSSIKSYKINAFKNFNALIARYLADQTEQDVPLICAGVAGPVRNGQARLTNHHWTVDATKLAKAFGAQNVHLINDLQAQAYALDDLPASSVCTLIEGSANEGGPRLVFCLGTGCNIATAHRIGDGLFVPASESGHTSLPDFPQHRALLDQLRLEEPHLPIEAALSSRGLSRLHAFLTGERLTSDEIVKKFPDETMKLFMKILGTCSGNLCLGHMATGGVYLIGGLARAVAPFLNNDAFKSAFCARGPYKHIMEKIPVSVVTDDNAGLLGCARFLDSQHK